MKAVADINSFVLLSLAVADPSDAQRSPRRCANYSTLWPAANVFYEIPLAGRPKQYRLTELRFGATVRTLKLVDCFLLSDGT
jgi:hypothetical protein